MDINSFLTTGLLASFLPLVTSFVVDQKWQPRTRELVAHLFAILVGAVYVLYQAHWQVAGLLMSGSALATIATITAVSKVAYDKVWSTTPVTQAIETARSGSTASATPGLTDAQIAANKALIAAGDAPGASDADKLQAGYAVLGLIINDYNTGAVNRDDTLMAVGACKAKYRDVMIPPGFPAAP